MSDGRDKKIAVIGAGIAGLTCAKILNKNYDVEIFEASEKGKESRPLQMEGGIYYCGFVPDLEFTYPLEEMAFSSENYCFTWKGKLGYAYKIGGMDGLDAMLRREVEKEVKINYATTITSLSDLKNFDIIIGADGFHSRIADLGGMRNHLPKMWGVGIGSSVEGDFILGKMESTFNTDIAPGGYRYLIPISDRKATLACACIAKKVNTKSVRKKLRKFAQSRDYKILDEWTDFEKWYDFHTYQKDNLYVIGGAASFTDLCFGFGLKYSIWSARLCANAIIEGTDYNKFLKPLLKELRYWENIGKWFIFASNKKYDRMMRLAKISIIRNRVQSGKSIAGFYRLLKLF